MHSTQSFEVHTATSASSGDGQAQSGSLSSPRAVPPPPLCEVCEEHISGVWCGSCAMHLCTQECDRQMHANAKNGGHIRTAVGVAPAMPAAEDATPPPTAASAAAEPAPVSAPRAPSPAPSSIDRSPSPTPSPQSADAGDDEQPNYLRKSTQPQPQSPRSPQQPSPRQTRQLSPRHPSIQSSMQQPSQFFPSQAQQQMEQEQRQEERRFVEPPPDSFESRSAAQPVPPALQSQPSIQRAGSRRESDQQRGQQRDQLREQMQREQALQEQQLKEHKQEEQQRQQRAQQQREQQEEMQQRQQYEQQQQQIRLQQQQQQQEQQRQQEQARLQQQQDQLRLQQQQQAREQQQQQQQLQQQAREREREREREQQQHQQQQQQQREAWEQQQRDQQSHRSAVPSPSSVAAAPYSSHHYPSQPPSQPQPPPSPSTHQQSYPQQQQHRPSQQSSQYQSSAPYQPSASQLQQQHQQHQQQLYQHHSAAPSYSSTQPIPLPFSSSSPVPPAFSSHHHSHTSVAPAAPASVVLIGDRCARLWGMLWHAQFKLRLLIPDSILFCNGAFHSYLFSSKQHRGEVRKKTFGADGASAAQQQQQSQGPKMNLEAIRSTLVRKAEQDPSNVTPFVAILQEHDAKVSCVKYHALPRVLRSMGALPESHRLAQASFAGVPHQAVDIDLYQLLRSYVHPLGGARFITTYVYSPDVGEGGLNMTSHVRAQAQGARPRHSLSTQVGRFADRYEVLPEERAFYEPGSDRSSEEKQQHSHSHHQHPSDSPPAPAVADSILRECERMTLCVVEWLSRIHGIGVSRLALEFVQNYSRKLVLHSIIDVVFLVEPSLHATPSLGMKLVREIEEAGDDELENEDTMIAAAASDRTLHASSYQSLQASEYAGASSPSSSSLAPSRTSSRPASASVSGGRTARAAARAMGASASSAVIPSTPAAAYAIAPAPAATMPRPSGFNASSSSHALTARPSRPQSARAPPQSGAATQRLSSDDLEEQLRNTQPPRGLVGLGAAAGAALPRTARQKVLATASKSGLAFTTLMQFETRTEMDERMSAGGLRAPASGMSVTAGPDGTPTAASGGRADFLLFHWRHQAREGHAEIVRLNSELDAASKAWATKENQLRSLLHMEEKKVALLSTQNQTGQMEIQALKHQLDEHRLTSTQRDLEAEKSAARAAKDIDVLKLLCSRLEDQNKRLQDELLQIAAEKSSGDSDASRLRRDIQDQQRLRARAEQELNTAQKVRDELLEKLEAEEKFARSLAQQLDLMSDWDAFEDMRHLFSKASGLARNEGQRLKEMDALRAQVVKYTKDKGWQDKKANITKQARAIKKGLAAGPGGAGGTAGAGTAIVQMDPVPERRATDIIYERALNRMTH